MYCIKKISDLSFFRGITLQLQGFQLSAKSNPKLRWFCFATIHDFTITAEILARSLANFYRQYADRHMNLKFVRRVSEREREIRPFVIVKHKLTSVFDESVLLLTMNFVITLSK